MKVLFLSAIALLLGSSSFALERNQRELSITSFMYIENGNTRNQGAELCGTVSGKTHAMDRITVISDYGQSNQASYTTMLDNNGNFCVIIRTYSGKAGATYWQIGASEETNKTVYAEVAKK